MQTLAEGCGADVDVDDDALRPLGQACESVGGGKSYELCSRLASLLLKPYTLPFRGVKLLFRWFFFFLNSLFIYLKHPGRR